MSNNTSARLREDSLDDRMTDDLADIGLLKTADCRDLCKGGLVPKWERVGQTETCNSLLADSFVVLSGYERNPYICQRVWLTV